MFRRLGRGSTVIILVILSLVWSVAGASAAARTSVIVVFDDAVANPSALARQMGRAHGFSARHVYESALKGFVAAVPTGAVAALAANPRVVHVEAETVEQIVAQTTPTGVDRIEVDKNTKAGVGGTAGPDINLDVAIIDTGINSHADLRLAGGFAAVGSTYNDNNGHGTHVAGTVAARDNDIGVVGVAPGARVWAVRVCGNNGFCMSGDIVKGIDWVVARKNDFKNGVNGGINFAAANFSISSADTTSSCNANNVGVNTTHSAICRLVATGVVFVMAAGNDARLKNAYPEAFTVAAITDFNGKAGGGAASTCRSDVDDRLASYSNWNVDIAAPGSCILSTWNNGGYNTISGTSMATPHVTGAVALYLHANNQTPATNKTGAVAIENAIVSAALPQSNACGYVNHRGTGEKLLFVNDTTHFKGSGACDTTSGSTPSPNTAPTANNMSVTTNQGTAVAVTLSGSDAETCNLTFSIVGGPSNGTLSSITNNACSSGTPNTDTALVTYTPNSTFSGQDSFTYRVYDGALFSSNATVSITVNSTGGGGGDPATMSATLGGASQNNGGTWTAIATATVTSGANALLAGALVSGTWTVNGSSSTASCTTGSNGQCSVSRSGIAKRVGSATFTVTKVELTNYTYSGSYPSIVISKP